MSVAYLLSLGAITACNFVGARNELEREANFFDPDAIQRYLSTRDGVEWRFNCPANPEAGGACGNDWSSPLNACCESHSKKKRHESRRYDPCCWRPRTCRQCQTIDAYSG